MLELNLPACPICQAQNSLSLETMDRAGKLFNWYECQACGSVLLWLEEDRWAYQKIGREDQAHLLKQPLTATELVSLAGEPGEFPAAPEQYYRVDAADEPSLVPEQQDLAHVTYDLPDEPLAEPGLQDLAHVPYDVPDEPLAAPSPSVLAVPTEEPDVAPEPPAPVPQKERKGPSRWLIIALVVIGLTFVLAVAGLLVANQLGYL